MFQAFDDKGAASFVNGMRGNSLLRSRIKDPAKMGRLRSLGNIVYEKVSSKFSETDILEALVDSKTEKKFISLLDRKA